MERKRLSRAIPEIDPPDKPTKRPGRGGSRPGAGRPKGALSRYARLARQQATLTGELPNVLLLRWVQQGYIHKIVTEPVQKGRTVVQEVVEDPDNPGTPLYDIEALSTPQRVALAVKVMPYFNPRLQATMLVGADGRPIDPPQVEKNITGKTIEGEITDAEMRAAAEEARRKNMANLPPETAQLMLKNLSKLQDAPAPKKEEIN